MAERESMAMHQNRLNQEAAAYKAEIELTMQKHRLREEAEEKIVQTRREAGMLEEEREVVNSEQPMTTNEPNSLRKRNRKKSDSENLRLR